MTKEYKQIFTENNGQNPKELGVRIRCLKEIMRYLSDVKLDLSNFDSALLRWSRRVKAMHEDKCTEIEDWLRQPNQEQTFEDLVKEIVFDLHVHGNAVPEDIVLNRSGASLCPGETVTFRPCQHFLNSYDPFQCRSHRTQQACQPCRSCCHLPK